jgi:hypothetical protein
VQSALAWFIETYCRFDRRVLGVFRIGFGATLLYDLLRRVPDAGLLWSSEGVLSAEALLRMPQSTPQPSLLLYCSSESSVQLAFAALGLVFFFYTIGCFTRVFQLLSLIGYASLNARNTFFEDGGTCTVILLLGWTLLLPLADRFSVDALRRDARLERLAERVEAREAARLPFTTLAAFALLLQAAAIYWLNAAHKSGQTWRAGDAVHLVFWQHRVNTPFGLWFSSIEPAWFSPASTWLTKRTEFLLPLLLLWPSHPLQTRTISFLIAVLLHGGIALALTLGPFSYAMICLVWLAVPGAALDWLAARVPTRWSFRYAALRARAVRSMRGWLPRRRRAPKPITPRRARQLVRLREVAIGYMLLVETTNLLGSNRAIPKWLRVKHPPTVLAGYKPYLRGWQGWSMFAPEAPVDDGTMVVDAVTTSGRHLDPFTGTAPDFEQIRRGLAPHSIALSDYFFAMRGDHNARYRRELHRWLRQYRAPGSGERLKSAEVYWARYVPPPRGQYVPGPIVKDKLWSVNLER